MLYVILSHQNSLYAVGSNAYSKLGLGIKYDNMNKVDYFQKMSPFTNHSLHRIHQGSYHAFVTDSESTLYGWGSNDFGQLGFPPKGQDKVIMLDQPTKIPFFEQNNIKVRYADGGQTTSVAIDANNMVYTWGGDMIPLGHDCTGQVCSINTDAFQTDEKAVDARINLDTFYLLTNLNQIYYWGSCVENSCGDTEDYSVYYPKKMILKTGNGSTFNASKFWVGIQSLWILDDLNNLYAIGNNSKGQLCGQQSESEAKIFHKVQGITGKISKVESSKFHTLILTEEGDVYGCGAGNQGQFGGQYNDEKQQTPVKIDYNSFASTVRDIAVTYNGSYLLTDKGVFSAGQSEYGELGQGNNDNKYLQFTEIIQLYDFSNITRISSHGDSAFMYTEGGKSKNNDISAGMIVVIVLCSLAGAAALIASIVFIVKCVKNKKKQGDNYIKNVETTKFVMNETNAEGNEW